MLLCTVLRFTRSVMIAYILHTFHSVPAYYTHNTTTVWEHFINAYCTCGPTNKLVHSLSTEFTALFV